jgi:hypothetical protein
MVRVALPMKVYLAVAAVLVSAGCQAVETTTLLGPSSTKCAITLPGSLPVVDAAGGAGTFTITAASECVWKATSETPWITITSGADGQGTGVVHYTASANPTALTRRGTVLISDSRLEFSQAGAPCRYDISPAGESFDAAGGEATVTVAALEGCQWSATSQAPWLSIVAGGSGTGHGTVRYRAAQNTGAARSGTLIIADRTFAVAQGATGATPQPCVLTIDRSEHSVSAAGGEDTVVVTGPPGCAWAATSHDAWITVISGPSGSGTGSVRLSIAPNPAGAARVGLVTIAGHTYRVTQAGTTTSTCAYSIAPTGQSAPAAGGTGTIAVSSASSCAWTAASQVSWITTTSGATGSGTGTVGLAIAPNTGAERTGQVVVAGHTYTVTQQAAAPPPVTCTYSIDPTGQSAPAAGGTGTIAVSSASSCAWTAASQVPWITITSGATGSGAGTVGLAIAPNTGAERTGQVVVAGHTYTVTQQAAAPPPVTCTYSIDATHLSAPATGATSVVGVNAPGHCNWTATSEAGWISITSGASGSGSGSVHLSVAPNPGSARSGLVTIAGQTYTVEQAAAPVSCSYTLGSTTYSAAAAGGAASVGVTTTAGCGWTATSQANWITVQGGAAGSGSGTVELSIAPNSAEERSGTVTIAGQTFTVTQAAAACTFALNPTTQEVKVPGGEFTVAVTTQPWCTWQATTADTWIQFTSAPTGTGSGVLGYAVGHSPVSRLGTITISGQTLTVDQTKGPS